MYHSFDTHTAVKSFVKSGMKTELAEAVVKTIAASREADLSHLATKVDLAEVKAEVVQVKAELSVEIEKAKNETLRWVIGLNIATISAVAAMFKFFIH